MHDIWLGLLGRTMAVKGKTSKRMRKLNEDKGKKVSEDRLSSLTDDILLEIISRLPPKFAVVTGSLSWRWLNLWKKMTSIRITNYEFKFLPKFIQQITSPSIHSFSVDFVDSRGNFTWDGLMDSFDFWLCQMCERNVRELKVTCPSYFHVSMITLPSVIFEMQSLVSLELCSTKGMQLPDGPINFPNLKKLSLRHYPFHYEWLGTLIKACPLLEELYLKCGNFKTTGHYMNCSNQNLRRLFIDSGTCDRSKVVINAPKLECLTLRAKKSVTFSFEVEPVGLRESKIFIEYQDYLFSEDENKVMSKFYGAICNNMSLTINIFGLHIMPRMLSILSSLELCPVLEVLILKVWDYGSYSEEYCILPNVSTSRRVIKKIKIETYLHNSCEPTKSFLELLKYLLSSARDLEHFHFKVLGDKCQAQGSPEQVENELKLCKLLHSHVMVAKGCEVEFVGRFFDISGKSCSKVWKTDDRVIHFD